MTTHSISAFLGRGAVVVATVAAVALPVLLGTQPAEAGQRKTLCMPREKAAAILGKRYKERPVGMGLASNGTVLELYHREDGASWTMIMTRPDGMSCVMATGKSWNSFAEVAFSDAS